MVEARNAPVFLSGGRLCSARRSRGRERDAENVMQTVAPRRKFVYNEPVRPAYRAVENADLPGFRRDFRLKKAGACIGQEKNPLPEPQ